MDIDLVYTWVNPTDLARARLRAHYANEVISSDREYEAGECRFRDHGELSSSIASVQRFLPFVRNIFVVSSGEPPNWLSSLGRVVFVTDDVIMPHEILPSFDSQTIEAYLYRIPGLSEHYLYSNDDFFFAQPHRPTDFFDQKGRCLVSVGEAFTGVDDANPVYRASELISAKSLQKRIKLTEFEYFGPPSKRGKATSHMRSKLRAWSRGLQLLNEPTHVTQPYLKSGWEDFHRIFQDEIAVLKGKRFRSRLSYRTNYMYLHYLRSIDRAVFIPETRHLYLDWSKGLDERERLRATLSGANETVTRFCLNDHVSSQSDDKAGWDEYVQDITLGFFSPVVQEPQRSA